MTYTREQILAMDTPQLKRLVAEHIMGYSVYHYNKDYEENCYFMLVDPSGEYQQLKRKTEEEAWNDASDFSIDISAAWDVVDKIGDCLHLKEHGETGEWEALFCGYPNSVAHGETAPLAISRAVLLAVLDL